MAIGDDRADKEAGLKILEELTTNANDVQNQVLLQILFQNSNTEYLTRFQLHSSLNCSNPKQAFKERVPIVEYDDIKPYIQRIASGEHSNIICGQPITEFFTSSGTSSGQPKLIPFTADDLERRCFFRNLIVPVINKYIEGLDQGKAMSIIIIKQEITTPSGLVARDFITSFYKNERFQNRPSNPFTSPRETVLCSDSKQSMYCQLLCSLVQRDEVLRIVGFFASWFLRLIKFLESYWKEMCSNIRTGQVSDWITDISCRNAVSSIMNKPSPELAHLIEIECGRGSWEGIIKRLWPKTKYIEVTITGSMAQYISTLEFYCDHLPLVSTVYSSSECFFGINLNPLCKPSDVSYTLIPNMAYFEFLCVDKPSDGVVSGQSLSEQAVDLVDVKVGHCYELLVTTFTGLYRYRVGDTLMVTGFHNKAPQFRFVERRNVVLSIDVDKTTEDDLLKAITRAKLPIEQLSFFLTDYTSYTDTSSIPGHYVLFWELVKKKLGDVGGEVEPDSVVMEECCSKVEEMLDSWYRRLRKDNAIGPLEIRVVNEGTFDELMDFFVAKGASGNLYKTATCVKSVEAIEILNSRVVGKYFSNNVPSWKLLELLEPISK